MFARNNPNITIRTFYWALGTTQAGKRCIIGSYPDEMTANSEAFRIFPNEYKVYSLRTKNKATAVSMIKAQLAQESGNIDDALTRIKHNENTNQSYQY